MTEPAALILIGAPAVGKTTIGGLLAQRFDCVFTDIDRRIESEQQLRVTEIFAARGEQAFRQLELEAIGSALCDGGVISLGGGAITQELVRRMLVGHQVIWLYATLDDVIRRITTTNSRPLLSGDAPARWSELMAEREPYYAEAATLRIEISGRKPERIVTDIISKLTSQEVL